MNDYSAFNPPEEKPILQTSVASRQPPHPDEVTVIFSRWTQVGHTAYQRGQSCGLLRKVADPLIKAGRCRVVG